MHEITFTPKLTATKKKNKKTRYEQPLFVSGANL